MCVCINALNNTYNAREGLNFWIMTLRSKAQLQGQLATLHEPDVNSCDVSFLRFQLIYVYLLDEGAVSMV